jgi:hypothetical protein
MDRRTFAASWFEYLALGVLACACLGCGKSASDTAHWAGKVTLDGQPVPASAQGSITFQPAAGSKGKAITVAIVDGTYDSPATPRGEVLAMMSLSIPTGKTYKSERTGLEVPEMNHVTLTPEQSQGIPLTVEGDQANHDFSLTSANNE